MVEREVKAEETAMEWVVGWVGWEAETAAAAGWAWAAATAG